MTKPNTMRVFTLVDARTDQPVGTVTLEDGALRYSNDVVEDWATGKLLGGLSAEDLFDTYGGPGGWSNGWDKTVQGDLGEAPAATDPAAGADDDDDATSAAAGTDQRGTD